MVKAGLCNGYMLLFMILSFVLNEIVIAGNDFIMERSKENDKSVKGWLYNTYDCA